jgi:hypothetical protein
MSTISLSNYNHSKTPPLIKCQLMSSKLKVIIQPLSFYDLVQTYMNIEFGL